jgi:hypothetical protein
MNSFFYGSKEINRANKMYPFVCSKLNKFISYSDSAFTDDPSKMSTGRVVVQKELNLVNSLTFEISFFGWVDPIKKTKNHFKVSEL